MIISFSTVSSLRHVTRPGRVDLVNVTTTVLNALENSSYGVRIESQRLRHQASLSSHCMQTLIIYYRLQSLMLQDTCMKITFFDPGHNIMKWNEEILIKKLAYSEVFLAFYRKKSKIN